MLPGQQVIAHNLVSWEPVCVCLAIFVSDCLHGELFVTSRSYQRRTPQSRNLAPSNENLCGGEPKVGKSILVINLALALAALGNQAGYPLKSLLPRPARNNGSSTTMACTTPCICIFAMAEEKSINEARFILRILMEKNLARRRQSQGQIGRMRSGRVSSLPHRDPELRPGLLGRVPRQASNSMDMLYFTTCAPPLWFGSDSTCDWPTTPHWRPL